MIGKRFLAAVFVFNMSVTMALAAGAQFFDNIPSLPNNYEVLENRNNAILGPTLRIESAHDTGSATAIKVINKANEPKILFLTNHHVIEHNIPHRCDEKKNKYCQLLDIADHVILHGWITRDGTLYPVLYTAKILDYDVSNDIAILEPDMAWAGPVANITPETIKLTMGEDVWVAGSALGERPHITTGLLSLTDVPLEKRSFFLISAPMMPGNSGGGLWVQRGTNYYLAGIPHSIALSGKDPMVNHGFVIPINRVSEVLLSFGYRIGQRSY